MLHEGIMRRPRPCSRCVSPPGTAVGNLNGSISECTRRTEMPPKRVLICQSCRECGVTLHAARVCSAPVMLFVGTALVEDRDREKRVLCPRANVLRRGKTSGEQNGRTGTCRSSGVARMRSARWWYRSLPRDMLSEVRPHTASTPERYAALARQHGETVNAPCGYVKNARHEAEARPAPQICW